MWNVIPEMMWHACDDRDGFPTLKSDHGRLPPLFTTPFVFILCPLHAAANKRRFLTYNLLGWITSREELTYNSIEIEYADKEKYKTARLTDHYQFTMAGPCVL